MICQDNNLPALILAKLSLWMALVLFALVAGANAQQPAGQDAYGDPLPDGAVARLGTVRFRHTGKITFAAFLPDGKSVLSVGMDQTMRVWEYPSGKELRRIGPPAVEKTNASLLDRDSGRHIPVALSNDRSKLAACFDGALVVVFDVVTGKELRKFKASVTNNFRGNVVSLSFAPKDTRLAIVNRDASAHVWDLADGKELCSLADAKANTSDGSSPLWCLDGQALVTTQGGTDAIDIWDATNGKKIRTVLSKEHSRGHVSSPNGTEVAYIERNKIVFVDIATGKDVRRWKDSTYAGPSLFSPDGAKLYGRSNEHNALVEWDPVTGKTLRTIRLTKSAPNGYGFLGDDCAAWSPDGSLMVLASGGCALQFVDVAAGEEIGPALGAPSGQSSVRFAPDGKYIWSRNIDGTVHKWDAVTSKTIDLPALSKTLWQGPSSPDGKIFVGSSTSHPPYYLVSAILDAATGKERSTFDGGLEYLNRHMVFSPDGKMIALHWAQVKKIMLLQVPTGEKLHSLPISGQQATVFYSPDSRTLAALADAGALALWDVTSGRRIADMPIENGFQVRSGSFSPDGRCIAIDFKDGTAAVYEIASGQARRTFGDKRPLSEREMTRSPNRDAPLRESRAVLGDRGQTLVYADFDRTLRVWDVDNRKELVAFKGHTDSVEAVALSPDSKTLASASADTTVLLWDMTRVKRPAPIVRTLSQNECDACWRTLLDADAVKAFAAICDLSASPKATLTFFKDRLKASPPLDLKRVEESVAALASDLFKTRQDATAELLGLDERATPAIDKMLAKNPNLETKRRLEEVRQKLGGTAVLSGERLRMHRAVEILERIGTPDARELLQTVANGAPGTLLTAAAQATLRRLRQRQ